MFSGLHGYCYHFIYHLTPQKPPHSDFLQRSIPVGHAEIAVVNKSQIVVKGIAGFWLTENREFDAKHGSGCRSFDQLPYMLTSSANTVVSSTAN